MGSGILSVSAAAPLALSVTMECADAAQTTRTFTAGAGGTRMTSLAGKAIGTKDLVPILTRSSAALGTHIALTWT